MRKEQKELEENHHNHPDFQNQKSPLTLYSNVGLGLVYCTRARAPIARHVKQ